MILRLEDPYDVAVAVHHVDSLAGFPDSDVILAAAGQDSVS